jgi:uncharacterized protein YggU (UPF0235/DUF167 family)
MIKAMVTAAPEKGKANSALVGLLAKSWNSDKLNAHLGHLIGEYHV